MNSAYPTDFVNVFSQSYIAKYISVTYVRSRIIYRFKFQYCYYTDDMLKLMFSISLTVFRLNFSNLGNVHVKLDNFYHVRDDPDSDKLRHICK